MMENTNEKLTNVRDNFLRLVRIGAGVNQSISCDSCTVANWDTIQSLAEQHGLFAIFIDGLERLSDNQRPPKDLLLQWIGQVLQEELAYQTQRNAACKMAHLFAKQGITTYVLKGAVIAECYPKPNHRLSADMDCYLLSNNGELDAWELGNQLVEKEGYEVRRDYYKNSTFLLPGLMVENHLFLTPFRGDSRLKKLEVLLQTLLRNDAARSRFDDAELYRPPVIVSALFLIEHAYSHFLGEGLTWRHVLDWIMFKKMHYQEVNWPEFEAYIDKFGFRNFYNSYQRLGLYLIGEISEIEFKELDKKMIEDVWSPLDLHETVRGIKGKLNLVGNTWRARWKYQYFSEISMIHALWIQIKSFLFIKHPRLDLREIDV